MTSTESSTISDSTAERPSLTPDEELQRGLRLRSGVKRLLMMTAVDSFDASLDWELDAVKKQNAIDFEVSGGTAANSAVAPTAEDGEDVKQMVAGDLSVINNHYHNEAAQPAATTTSGTAQTTGAVGSSGAANPTGTTGTPGTTDSAGTTNNGPNGNTGTPGTTNTDTTNSGSSSTDTSSTSSTTEVSTVKKKSNWPLAAAVALGLGIPATAGLLMAPAIIEASKTPPPVVVHQPIVEYQPILLPGKPPGVK